MKILLLLFLTNFHNGTLFLPSNLLESFSCGCAPSLVILLLLLVVVAVAVVVVVDVGFSCMLGGPRKGRSRR